MLIDFAIPRIFRSRALNLLLIAAFSCLVTGCKAPGDPANGEVNTASGVRVRGTNFTGGIAVPDDEVISLAGAKNEAISFAVQITGLKAQDAKSPASLRISAMSAGNNRIDLGTYEAFQVLNMPVDVNRAGYIRHTGQLASSQTLPRALLPLKIEDGRINLSTLRDPAKPTDARATAGAATVTIWVDVRIPPETIAGDYTARCDVIAPGQNKPLAAVALQLRVHDFVLPDERHLMMVGPIEWGDLTRLYGDRFEAVTPNLLSRADPRYADAIKTLDQLVDLAQRNRAQLTIPRLQPTVKWPSGRPPQVDWRDYDALVSPWLKGDTFPDKTPYGYWPLPEVEHLTNYDSRSQQEYWSAAAAHFDQLDWLSRSAVVLRSARGGRVDSSEALKLSADAAAILALNARLRVEVPLEDDQVQFADANNSSLVATETANRLITANPGLVFASPARSWPVGVARPTRWLRTDLTGLIPYVGAGGDERDTRVWAWFASVPLPPPQMGVQLGPVRHIRWPTALPKASNPNEAADPNELVWFYPGSWFGVDQPVPTIQLKWLRRAQQDFEYLYLARQRGETINALVIARLMSKPVEIQPGQSPDPTFGLMSGTSNAEAWRGALRLLAQRILLREPGTPIDEARDTSLNIELHRWAEPQERPVTMGRNVNWIIGGDGQSPTSIATRLGIDIYNAADRLSYQNALEFSAVPAGWRHLPQPVAVPELGTYHVQRFPIEATIEPLELRNNDRRPIDLLFTDGFTKKQSKLQLMIPIAMCDRREGAIRFDGSLEDWSADDAIQEGPLVRMFTRPALHTQTMEFANSPTNVYTGWAEENFYVAFKVTGLSGAEGRAMTNFVTYQFRRAWGEDLCELMVQAEYADNSLGPVLHIVCKPNANWVERKMDPRLFADPWQPITATSVRYAATLDGPDWRGEVAIPWKAITADDSRGRPVLLRFNFTQHKALSGESASWAGPIDFGRDENFMGALILREPNNPGMR